MDFYQLAGVFALGALSGIGVYKQWLAVAPFLLPSRPLRLSRARFEMTAPVTALEPAHRLPQWITYTHAYIMRGEMCQRTPLNVREMRGLTGLSSRQQKKYMEVLEQGRVVAVIPSGGVRWLVGKRDRRRVLTRLPYPREVDPPPFIARLERDGRNSP